MKKKFPSWLGNRFHCPDFAVQGGKYLKASFSCIVPPDHRGIAGNLCVLSPTLLWDKMCDGGPIEHQLDPPLYYYNIVWYQKVRQKHKRFLRRTIRSKQWHVTPHRKILPISCGKIWCNLCLICSIVTYNKIGKIRIFGSGIYLLPLLLLIFSWPNFLWQKISQTLGNETFFVAYFSPTVEF